ncbi:MAG: TorF family putative porin [Gammaproteobacteria bacterium]
MESGQGGMGHGEHQYSGAASLTVVALAFALSAIPVHAAAPAVDLSQFHLDLAVTSDYVVQGVTRSQGDPSLQGQLGWMNDAGWMAGAWLATINLNPGHGPTWELDPYVAKRWVLGRDWSARMDLTRYVLRPSLRNIDYDYTDVRAALSFRDVVDMAIGWSPDYSGYSGVGVARRQTMITYEASGHLPASRWLAFNAGIGRRDLQDAFGRSYWYWSAGAEAAVERWSLGVSYIGTSRTASDLFGSEYAGDRVVATIALKVK